jgi:hypothetical protein
MALETEVYLIIEDDRENCGDSLVLSPEKLMELAENVNFLANRDPLPIPDHLKEAEIDYSEGHRTVRVLRGFRSIPVTEEVEKRLGLKPGLYDSTLVPNDKLKYDVSDFAKVTERNNPSTTHIRFIEMEHYTEEEMRSLRSSIKDRW